jgi:two-component system OmpR family response regulator/two-component system response regulator QseB
LAARARALTRRSAGRAAPLIEHGSLSVDPAAHKVMVDGAAVELSTREFAILEALLDNAGRVLTRAQLETHVYGWTAEPDSNAVEVHIHHLRRKLGGNLIKTLRGVGYMIDKLA